ncbi:loquacious [Bombyx mori]|uniref:Loquacious n=1 Tax=Bombyx mori TaxID=7091 RepID=D7UT12_BOMMO|nr:loquacious [Bombyx mori]BAJ11656.1 loquacious [Bombyx mori]
MEGNTVHPHPSVVPGLPPGVIHGMTVHGSGPNGEHFPHGPRRRYQTRPKPNNLQRLPLDEAAKRKMETLPTKTPVSVLQELLARRETVPKYELLQIEGMIHEPTFRYRVTVADLFAMGTGRSKKEAKHSAAKALLDKLTGATPSDQTTNGSVPETGAVVPTFEDKLMGNPVGWLRSCVCHDSGHHHLTMLKTMTMLIDQFQVCPHERQFTIICTLLKRREVGTGKSKKLAKRQAAYKMWQALQDNPPESFQNDDEGGVAARYADLKDSKISTLTTSHSHKVSQFHKHLKQSVGPNLAKLQVTPLNNKDFNFVQFLQEIASEQSFEVTYVDIEEKSMTGLCQCLVQLSTLPVAVCHGAGLTSKDAQSSAAQNALEYLKIMTKK